MEHGKFMILVHCTLELLRETWIPSLESFGCTVTKLHSGQVNRDDANAAATTDKSNPYMSPSQATQK